MYSFCAMYSFRMSFCSVPDSRDQSTPCFSATAKYMAHMIDAGELMVIETVTSPRGMPSNRVSISASEKSPRRTCPLRPAPWDIGIEAHQRRQVEGHRQTRLALLQQIAKARVGLFGRGETRELAHGPQPATIHRFVDTAGVGELSRCAQLPRARARPNCSAYRPDRAAARSGCGTAGSPSGEPPRRHCRWSTPKVVTFWPRKHLPKLSPRSRIVRAVQIRRRPEMWNRRKEEEQPPHPSRPRLSTQHATCQTATRQGDKSNVQCSESPH